MNAVDINLATQTELATVSGCGPILAMNIVRHRECFGPYRDVFDLSRVDGISAYGARQLKKNGMVCSGLTSRPSMTDMTLRQWYAGMAMAAMLGEPDREGVVSCWLGSSFGGDDCWNELAKNSFDIADAMLAHDENEKGVE